MLKNVFFITMFFVFIGLSGYTYFSRKARWQKNLSSEIHVVDNEIPILTAIPDEQSEAVIQTPVPTTTASNVTFNYQETKMEVGAARTFSSSSQDSDIFQVQPITRAPTALRATLKPMKLNTPRSSHTNKVSLFPIYSDVSSEQIKQKIASGANVNEKDINQMSPLMILVRKSDDVFAVQTLLEAGADVQALDYNKSDALMMATAYNHNPSIIQLLVDSGADINRQNKNGWTPLMMAAGFNTSDKVVQTLIKNRPDFALKNNRGMRALEIAFAYNKNISIASIIQTSMPVEQLRGFNPLFVIAKYNSYKNMLDSYIKGMKELNKNFDINQRDAEGNTALMMAAQSNRPEIVQVLLEASADKTIRNKNGQTAYELAQTNPYLTGSQILLLLK